MEVGRGKFRFTPAIQETLVGVVGGHSQGGPEARGSVPDSTVGHEPGLGGTRDHFLASNFLAMLQRLVFWSSGVHCERVNGPRA